VKKGDMTSQRSGEIGLVTGADKGIGREIARRLGQVGMTVLVGSRDRERGPRPPMSCAGMTSTPAWSTSTW
jgi:NAD(P)-dependent dehydrogenase (short-subunit alcohol dehydrogenase family)